MGNLILDEGSVFVEKEATEGTYVPETSGEKAIEVLSDGVSFSPSKELIERDNRTSTVETVPGRVGQKSMAGEIKVEYKAGAVEGDLPEATDLYEALLGGKDELVEVTSLTGHTNQIIYLDSADIGQYKVGHIVKVKDTVEHVSPIKAIDTVNNALELLIPADNAFSDNVVIAKSVQYYHKSGQPTLSLTNYIGGKIREKAIGMRPTKGELSDFSTGKLPVFNFSLEGVNFDREVGQPLFSPEYDSLNGALPPIVLCAKVYKNSDELEVNNVGISLENTLGFKTSTASCSGKTGSRITKFNASFTLDPYMSDSDTENFNLFVNNEAFSIFGSAFNGDDTNAGAKNQVVAFYLPNCRIPEISTADQEGIVTEQINGTAHKSQGNDTIFLAFI